MAHPLLSSQHKSFQPIGHTPPKDLLNTLSPEEHADVLLLGAGDPRHILFSVHADLGSYDRKLDFTCCDIDPAILARNALLLTMIADGVDDDVAFRLFYHLLLRPADCTLLIKHSQKLVTLSPDLKTWHSSKYGKFLRVCSEDTLQAIRGHWAVILAIGVMNPAEKTAYALSWDQYMKSIYEKTRRLLITSRSAAGPLAKYSHLMGAMMHSTYWETGITFRTQEEEDAREDSYVPNPTMGVALSRGDFNLHYATEPLKSFHWAPALTILEGAQSDRVPVPLDIAKTAVAQFSSWCSSLRARLAASGNKQRSSIQIRFFVGDSIAFSRALQVCKNQETTATGVPTTPWTMSTITLGADYDSATPRTQRAPTQFNVIDTSDLVDHLGLYNVLLPAIPLLQRKPWSTLYTNTIVIDEPEANALLPSSLVEDALVSDVPTLSVLLGIAPLSTMSHFTSLSDKHQIIASFVLGDQFHESIQWRFPSGVVPMSAEDAMLDEEMPLLAVTSEAHLVQLLFSVYLRMFEERVVAKEASVVSQAGDDRADDDGSIESFKEEISKKKPEKPTRPDTGVVHYTTTTFVHLLEHLRSRIDPSVNWERVMRRLVRLVQLDTTIPDSKKTVQELQCQMYLHGVLSVPLLSSSESPTVAVEATASAIFSGWKNDAVPPVVCVLLHVPRARLADLEKEEVESPVLWHAEVHSLDAVHVYTNIRPVFGKIVESEDEDKGLSIEEDGQRWYGTSDLLVAFDVPSSALLEKEATVGLYIRRTVSAGTEGPGEIFSASIEDTKSVRVLRRRPGEQTDIVPLLRASAVKGSSQALVVQGAERKKVTVTFDDTGTGATSLTIRKYITGAKALKSLAKGAVVSDEALADTVVRVYFETNQEDFVFPHPVYPRKRQIRVLRRPTAEGEGAYIEVECPLRAHFNAFDTPAALSLNMFPIALVDKTKSINLLNMHYLNLDLLPALELPQPRGRLEWLDVHLSALPLSPAEKRALTGSSKMAHRPTYANLKESLATIALRWSGARVGIGGAFSEDASTRTNTIAFVHAKMGAWAILFVNALRLDLAAHTLVVDATLVHVHPGNAERVNGCMLRRPGKGLTQIGTLDDEVAMLKRLLPLWAERCRTWKHRKGCEFRREGVPVDGAHWEARAFCACAKGQDARAFRGREEYEVLKGEAIRVAVGPLFAHTFVADDKAEEVAERVGRKVVSAVLAAGAYTDLDSELEGSGLRSGSESAANLDTANASASAPSSSANPNPNANGKGKPKSKSNANPKKPKDPFLDEKPKIENPDEQCAKCGRDASLLCAACKKKKYCSQACQKADWKVHKEKCNK